MRQDDDPPKRGVHNSVWVFSTYFAEGFPYAIVHNLAEVLFKQMGASLQAIGLTSLFHLPWNLKFLWGPFLDAYGTKRKWLLWTEIVLSFSLIALALSTQHPSALVMASGIFLFIGAIAATHDVAIDGYYLEALDDRQQSVYVGFRAAAYKLAMLAVSGPLLLVIAYLGWLPGLLVLALIMLAILAFHHVALPHRETDKRPVKELLQGLLQLRLLLGSALLVLAAILFRWLQQTVWYDLCHQFMEAHLPWLQKISIEGWIGILLLSLLVVTVASLPLMRRLIAQSESFYARAFVNFLEQPQIGRVLAFVVLFRAGEALLLKMRYPFFDDMGMTLTQYSVASGTIGLILSFTATLLGGFLISAHSLRRWIWPFVIMQNLLNLLFAGIGYWALSLPEGETIGVGILSAVIGIESFGSGLGTAVFMVYLMRCCRPDFKAAHMAIVTALMSISYTLSGVTSGFLADSLGYGHYFTLSFFATLPGMMLIPFIPHLDAPQETTAS